MVAFSSDVLRLLRHLTQVLPGDHTIYVRNDAHSYLQAHQGVASTALTAPAAALMPNVVIKSHTPASGALRSILEARSPSNDVPPRARLNVVDRLLDIIGLVNGHRAAIVREDESLVVWARDVRDAVPLLYDMQQVLDAWYYSRAPSSGSSWRRPSMLEVDRVFDDYVHDCDYLVPSGTGSSHELMGLLLHMEHGTLPPLPILGEASANADPVSLSFAAPCYGYFDVAVLSPRPTPYSPMLGDSPVELGNVYTGLRPSSPGPATFASPSSSSPASFTLSSFSGTSSPKSLLSTPATVAPSDLSPQIQTFTPVLDDDLFLMDVDADSVEMKDVSEAADSLANDVLSTPSPEPSPLPRDVSPEINVIPPDDDVPLSKSPSAPKAKGKKRKTAAVTKPSSRRKGKARLAAAVQSSSSTLNAAGPATRSRTRASTSTEHAPETSGASAERDVRPLPSRAVQPAPCTTPVPPPSTEEPEPLDSAHVGCSGSGPYEDESSDPDAEGQSDYEDDDRSGDYVEASKSKVEGSSCSRTSRKRGCGEPESTQGRSKKKKKEEKDADRTCPACRKRFTRAADCTRHMNTCRATNSPCIRFFCPADPAHTFSRLDALQRHLRSREACREAVAA
ncbi:hypothetical protein OH77DRAFT_723915 [Trametes cingulata]|nr:hypothetical protein OH77DRAFT_723915 [Trametes cingulata]